MRLAIPIPIPLAPRSDRMFTNFGHVTPVAQILAGSNGEVVRLEFQSAPTKMYWRIQLRLSMPPQISSPGENLPRIRSQSPQFEDQRLAVRSSGWCEFPKTLRPPTTTGSQFTRKSYLMNLSNSLIMMTTLAANTQG